MFNKYLLKNIPSEYAYAGYNVRKSLTVLTNVVNGKVVYDVFEFTYVDSYMSFYIKMDDGSFKCVENDTNVKEVTIEEMPSKHLFRGEQYNLEEYTFYDKNQIYGAYGLKNMVQILEEADKVKEGDDTRSKIKIQAFIDKKPSYTGMEIMGAINAFNKELGWKKELIIVPAIKYDQSDTYDSLIGDMIDFYDFLDGKNVDKVIVGFKKLNDFVDGVGNKLNVTDIKEEKDVIDSMDLLNVRSE